MPKIAPAIIAAADTNNIILILAFRTSESGGGDPDSSVDSDAPKRSSIFFSIHLPLYQNRVVFQPRLSRGKDLAPSTIQYDKWDFLLFSIQFLCNICALLFHFLI